jgi:hypothetical protein
MALSARPVGLGDSGRTWFTGAEQSHSQTTGSLVSGPAALTGQAWI